MTKDPTRHRQIVEALADHVLAHGLAGSSLRPLARGAGLSDRMLLYHFRDKAEALGAALDVIAARMTALLGAATAEEPLPLAALRTRLGALVLDDGLWPYMALWLELASGSARGDPFCREAGERIGRGFLAWGAAQLESADDASRTREAAQLLASIEGLVLLKSIGLDDACQSAL